MFLDIKLNTQTKPQQTHMIKIFRVLPMLNIKFLDLDHFTSEKNKHQQT